MLSDHPRLQEIEQILIKFDLNETERAVYLAGLVTWPATVIQISRQSTVARLSVHQAVTKLIDMGLFLETYYGKKRLVYPHSIDGLYALLEEKKFALQQLENSLDASKNIFDYIKQSRESFPQTRMYQGIEGINTTLLEMAKDAEPISIIYDANALQLLVDEKIFHRSYTQRAEKKIQTRLILPTSFRDFWHLEWKDDYDVMIRTLPDRQIIQWGIEIWWAKIALHCYQESFVTTTIIENRQIAQILLVMYESMRSQAKDYQEGFLLV